ncbi:MAG: hypothetical protein LC539_19795 [Candidatus Thiodiazotropha sp.]|nr:hypothetical protein [Candidatus Thiodiazotropha sp.]MCU7872014.1 hypothetical protein [Candidatus Thiodiazotropha sp. (ex Lucinoma borealis)]
MIFTSITSLLVVYACIRSSLEELPQDAIEQRLACLCRNAAKSNNAGCTTMQDPPNIYPDPNCSHSPRHNKN